jgi:hypothetical protein
MSTGGIGGPGSAQQHAGASRAELECEIDQTEQ